MTAHEQKIVPHFWFEKDVKEAAEFYATVFPESKVTSVSTLYDTPSGDVDTVAFELWGQKFMAIGAGPLFKPNPSISFFVNFDPSREENAREMLDEMWQKLSEGGKALMPLDKYPFSDWYGWIEDRYGLSWQLILTNPEGDPRPPIVPSFLFVNDVCGQAEDAMNLYLSVFNNSKPGMISRYPEGMEPDEAGTLMFADFMLENQWFAAMDSAHGHQFNFNEAISLMVYCDTQAEIDAYWEQLSAVPEAEQCGWLKDKFGVSWQIVPTAMDEMMSSGTPEQLQRVTEAFLAMKKFDLDTLKRAYEGE